MLNLCRRRSDCTLAVQGAAEGAGSTSTSMTPLILKRASASRSSGQWIDDDYDVLENGVVVGRIMLSPAAPQDRQWMWASGHSADSVARSSRAVGRLSRQAERRAQGRPPTQSGIVALNLAIEGEGSGPPPFFANSGPC